MPTFKVTDPTTGQTLTLTGDSPPTEAELNEIFSQIPAPQPTPPIKSTLTGDIEQLAALGSGIVAEPIAGLAGIAQTLNPFAEEGAGARAVEATREALTFKPRTEAGIADLQITGEALAPVGEAFKSTEDALGGFAFELTGSPAIASAATSLPTAVFEALGLASLRSVSDGTRLLTPEGRPTRELEVVLDRQGLTFDNLTDTAKAEIPEIADKKLLRIGGKADRAEAAENALIEQIKSGGSDDALATLKVVNNRIAPDKIGAEAVKQGFEPGLVQLVKTTNASTKAKMKDMLNLTKRIKANLRVSQDVGRPTDIVGDAVVDRIKFIRGSANDARLELNDIAKNELGGQSVNATRVIDRFQESMDKLDVRLIEGADGVPKPVFRESLISKDRTSQKVIKDLIDLMSEGSAPDALRFHKMKRQLDNMIDFRKKSAGGLSEAGRNVLKDIRSSLNDAVREVNPRYAEVNDKLSSALTSLDDFKKVSGSTIDIFGEGSNKAIGQDLRGLMSNRKSRVNLENAVNNLDSTAANLGGLFNDNIKDLSTFANSLDDRFGAVAKTSLKGEVESAIRGGARDFVREKVVEKAAKGFENLRGVNEFSAFRSMEDLLSR